MHSSFNRSLQPLHGLIAIVLKDATWRVLVCRVSQGQFACGALRCQERRDLHSYELNFKYKEAGEVKNELVKVRGVVVILIAIVIVIVIFDTADFFFLWLM